jgi:hypothetical protein
LSLLFRRRLGRCFGTALLAELFDRQAMMSPACVALPCGGQPLFGERSELNIHWHVGQIIKLVSLRRPSDRSEAHLPDARPVAEIRSEVASDSERSYGVLRDDAGREVFFAPELLVGAQGFDDLHRGQFMEFTFDEPFLRAAAIHPLLLRTQAVPAAV